MYFVAFIEKDNKKMYFSGDKFDTAKSLAIKFPTISGMLEVMTPVSRKHKVSVLYDALQESTAKPKKRSCHAKAKKKSVAKKKTVKRRRKTK